MKHPGGLCPLGQRDTQACSHFSGFVYFCQITPLLVKHGGDISLKLKAWLVEMKCECSQLLPNVHYFEFHEVTVRQHKNCCRFWSPTIMESSQVGIMIYIWKTRRFSPSLMALSHCSVSSQRMKNITHTLTYARGTLGIGCIRFKHAGIRRGRKLFLSMLKNLVRIPTYGLNAEYARGTLLIGRVRWSYRTASVL